MVTREFLTMEEHHSLGKTRFVGKRHILRIEPQSYSINTAQLLIWCVWAFLSHRQVTNDTEIYCTLMQKL